MSPPPEGTPPARRPAAQVKTICCRRRPERVAPRSYATGCRDVCRHPTVVFALNPGCRAHFCPTPGRAAQSVTWWLTTVTSLPVDHDAVVIGRYIGGTSDAHRLINHGGLLDPRGIGHRFRQGSVFSRPDPLR